ncbi:ABC transporter substrate-binding protein [Nisaea acidiphila]|uniref:ABC transporter substrate-binding protein n=1 Tax=Nisaea acidiphila TaxID=1862145 RepID=A0A9J7ALG5_9PROT|nr:ABC transporter substrate-binding protein [Nisaea acidiphila]UUX48015.1 ABC transporter substrate-binding protein [Nisaea acidiphila]
MKLRYLIPALVMAVWTAAASAEEIPSLAEQVANGTLPPLAERLPQPPMTVDFGSRGKSLGRYGGTMRMLMARSKDTRQMTVYGYARLVSYRPGDFELFADILEKFEVEDEKVFTFTLRKNHRWSDGHPFTAEDFRYFWEDVANNEALSPSGPPNILLVDGEAPLFQVLDERTVRYSWSKPNPDFLPSLAKASPLYLYRPAHYLKPMHAAFADPEALAKLVEDARQRNWAALHNKMDNLYRMDNPDLPVLQPWRVTGNATSTRFRFERNPYFHRVDPKGRQLPYIDEVIFNVASPGLIPAKAGAGDTDLQARYLSFDDYTFLKEAEDRFPFDTRLWRTAKGSHMALFPNLNAEDPAWRGLFRDVRFRRALSLAINRYEINQVIYYGLAYEGNNTVLPDSPLFEKDYQTRWAGFDLKQANRLLDEIGLERGEDGIRLLPDGRPLELIVETAGESTKQTDILSLIHDSWLDAGIKLFTRPSQRNVFRNRIFSGQTLVSVWSGAENGLATAFTSPADFVPYTQQQLQWPQWGQHIETGGQAGAAIDMPAAERLRDLYFTWRDASTRAAKLAAWKEILEINADQVFTIGLVSGVLQPVVVHDNLQNVPEKAIYNWDPGAHFGVYLPDTFWYGEAPTKSASAD